jgi:hypothetical protein
MRHSLLTKTIIALASILFLSSCVISELKESTASTGGTEESSTTSTTTTKTTTSNDDSASTGGTTGGTKTSTSTSSTSSIETGGTKTNDSSSTTSSVETGGSEIEDDDDKESTGGTKTSASSNKQTQTIVLTPLSIGLTSSSSSKDDYIVSPSNLQVSYENMYSSGTSFMMPSYRDATNGYGGEIKIETPDNYLFVGIKFSFPTDYTYTEAIRYQVGENKRYIIDATYSVDGFSRSYSISDDIDELELLNTSKNVIALTSLEVIIIPE